MGRIDRLSEMRCCGKLKWDVDLLKAQNSFSRFDDLEKHLGALTKVS